VTIELVLGWLCALLVGYSINQGGTCGVAAARDLVHRRRIDLFAGFAVATGAAGIVCLPAAWVIGTDAHLAGMAPITPALFVGAILLGLGAVLNDACLLGSLWRLGNGELRLLALPVGLGLGFALAGAIPRGIVPALAPNALATPTTASMAVVTISGLIFIAAMLVLRRYGTPRTDHWPLGVAMGFLGVVGALLFLMQPAWSYADAVRRGVAPLMAMMMGGWGGAIAAVLTVVGAAASAIRLRVFRPVWPTLGGLFRSVGGGVLIALGATMIPGGNDTLLLASVPAGSVSGAIAYTIMTFVVIATIALLKYIRLSESVSAAD
jgi:uncharacterized protein